VLLRSRVIAISVQYASLAGPAFAVHIYFCAGVPKLDDANDAGTKNSLECTLILTEGDSAKTLAVSGLSVVGRDRYGVFPLRGKLLNVRDASHSQVRPAFVASLALGGCSKCRCQYAAVIIGQVDTTPSFLWEFYFKRLLDAANTDILRNCFEKLKKKLVKNLRRQWQLKLRSFCVFT